MHTNALRNDWMKEAIFGNWDYTVLQTRYIYLPKNQPTKKVENVWFGLLMLDDVMNDLDSGFG